MKEFNPFYLLLILMFSSCISSSKLAQIKNDKTMLYPIGDNGKWGYADSSGETVIPYQFESVSFFREGLAAVAVNGKYGFIKSDGNFHLKPKYELAENFIRDCAKVIRNGEKYSITMKGSKCKKGRLIVGGCIPPMPTKPSEKHAVQKDDKFALLIEQYIIREDGKEFDIVLDTTDFIFQDVMDFSFHYLLVKKDNKYGLFPETTFDQLNIDSYACEPYPINERIRICFKYDEVLLNYQKFAGGSENYSISQTPFRIGNYWGIMNGLGKELIPAKYLSLEIYDWRLAKVEYEAGKFGFIKIHEGTEYFKRKEAS